jgi:N-acetylneuraminate synthase
MTTHQVTEAGVSFMFGDRQVGGTAPVFCIAELSGNHNGSRERAVEMLHAAADAGADAIKVQTYTADTITLDSDAPDFRAIGLWEGRTLHDLYAEASMPWEWQIDLAKEAADRGVQFFSSVFDESAVDFLESVGVAAYKIASFELVDVGLIAAAARTGKPLIISTGMGTLAEIEEAVEVARAEGSGDIALLACTSAYPAPASAAHLQKVPHLAGTFGVVAGISDHTIGNEVPIAATALGAKVIEKHFTLRRADGGVDSAFSLEPAEFAEMVHSVRTTEDAVSGVQYGVTDADEANRKYRRSLFVAHPVAAGAVIKPGDVRSVRPATGLHPRHLDEVVGRVASRDLEPGAPVSWDMLAAGD